MPNLAQATESGDLVFRLRRVLTDVQLDCQCRTTLDKALDRFSVLEHRRRLRNGLRQARLQRDWIANQLRFLAELDEITERETDHTVFEEMAVLFDEIRASAASAAQVIRETGSLAVSNRDKEFAHPDSGPQ